MSRATFTSEEEAEALAACSAEPIHIPGQIQSFAALLAVDPDSLIVTHVSANLPELLGLSAVDVLGKHLKDVVDRELIHIFNNARNLTSFRAREGAEDAPQRIHLTTYQGVEQTLWVSAHAFAGRYLLEFEQGNSSDARPGDPLQRVSRLLEEVAQDVDLDTLLKTACKHLRAISGFDRVMAYHFLPDGAGEVRAESRSGLLEPYLGLRFPAYDVPAQAKAMYQVAPIRVIGDVEATPVGLESLDAAAEPLDLSLAVSRAVAPVHLQYLANMGVRSSLSLPILCEGKLWGLFALHNQSQLRPDSMRTLALEVAGKLLSLRVEQALRLRREQLLRSALSLAGRVVVAAVGQEAARAAWDSFREDLSDLIPNAGVALTVDGLTLTQGFTLVPKAREALAEQLASRGAGPHAIEALAQELPDEERSGIGGVLTIPIGSDRRVVLQYFRREIARTLDWAGAPGKGLVASEEGTRLLPRASFAHYQETISDRSEPWLAEELERALGLRDALATAIDRQQRIKAQEHLGLLVRELNHRVRNILALISSMTAQLARPESGTLEGYADALRARITALADAHNILTHSDMQLINLAELLAKELRPYLSTDEIEKACSGPDVHINADATSVLVLLLHELTSNAVKYGALSTTSGELRVFWSVDETRLRLFWRESGGPLVGEPAERGFGMSLIENAVSYELGGSSAVRFLRPGLEVDIELPGRYLVEDSKRLRQRTIESSSEYSDELSAEVATVLRPTLPLAVHSGSVLLLEDNFLVATETSDLLRSLGFREVVCASNLGEARRALASRSFDLCVLDVNVQGETSLELARSLVASGQRFFFTTGYGSEVATFEGLESAPILTKPVGREDLEAMLDRNDAN